jgi:hypothetical protein
LFGERVYEGLVLIECPDVEVMDAKDALQKYREAVVGNILRVNLACNAPVRIALPDMSAASGK